MDKIIIIGGVAAGATAAAKARRISPTAQITMIEAGPDISFANCGLPYYIGGDIKSRSKLILQSPESFKNQYNVDVYIETEVTKIDRNAHIISTINSKTGEKKTFEYTKLILAQGGRPVTPTLPGAGLAHVFTLWTLEDMDKIANYIENNHPKSAVVVGGGFIGLEMVEALVKRDIKVNVVEMMSHVMNVMDAETAGFIENELLSYSVGIHKNIGVNEIGQSSVLLGDGSAIEADMVLWSIGVRPTLKLAIDAGLALGEAGGLLVSSTLQTSDPDIFAAGDMVEIEHRVNGKKVRIPLAGPANRQGRIAAENVFGAQHLYKGALGTSIVRVFDAVAGITGFSLKQAKSLGIDADAVVVHKEHHTAYYPNAEMVSVMVIYDKKTGVIIGGQTAGYKGADKRLDVIATAVASKLTISDLADIDFAYSPPIGTANDALNMAAFTAENKMTGFSVSIMVSEIDDIVGGKAPYFLDVRDMFAFKKGHIKDAVNKPLDVLYTKLNDIPVNRMIIIYDETGKKGHQALRVLVGAGFTDVANVSGGFISLNRHSIAVGFKNIKVEELSIQLKSLKLEKETQIMEISNAKEDNVTSPIVIDVRTPTEYITGAFPNAINIPLDKLPEHISQLGSYNRDITVYCASGGRSSYAEKMLRQAGFLNVKNGGGIMQMMTKIH